MREVCELLQHQLTPLRGIGTRHSWDRVGESGYGRVGTGDGWGRGQSG